MIARAVLTACSIAVAALSLDAQVTVRVRSAADAPIPGVTVELWSSLARVSARTSDADGTARFLAAEAQGATGVLVRRIGFTPARAFLARDQHEVRVVMAPLASSIATVTVSEARRACPQRDDAEARAVWERARQSYDTENVVGRFSWFTGASGPVDAARVGQPDSAKLVRRNWQWTTDGGIRGARVDADRGKYVVALTAHNSPDLGRWGYMDLAGGYAQHFSEARFGDRHTFTELPAGADGERTLRLCARDRTRTGVDGTLRLAGDGSFVAARWTFWNPSREAEPAGGEVVFAPREEAVLRPLFAASGLFWRRLASGAYHQNWKEYEQYELRPCAAPDCSR